MTETHGEAAEIGTAIRPLVRPEPMRVHVQNALRELIIKRMFEPGQHLVESEVAARLEVSRQPVREALQALQLEGWIDLRVGRGAFVHTPTTREVNEAFAVRGVLEEESTRLATAATTADGFAQLREICRDGRHALEASDFDEVVAANARLHRRIAEFADNAVLAGVLGSIDQRVRWYFTPLARVRGADSWNEHDQIIEAMAAGDQRRAATLMRRHTEHTRQAYNAAGNQA
ncbi:MAG: GntR family transcriptional regulator [Nocardioidaceae bacterium]